MGLACLTTSSVISFTLFIEESIRFRVVFAVAMSVLFLVIVLATLVVLLPYSDVGGRDARRSRGLLLGASAAVLLVSVVIRAALAA